MISIDLPWPPSELHPNARVHWAKKANFTKRCRRFAWAQTLSVTGVRPLSVIGLRRAAHPQLLTVTAIFCPPDKRRRDTDGMLSACKAYFDGIADALGVDDSRWQLSLRREAPVKHGLVRIELAAS